MNKNKILIEKYPFLKIENNNYDISWFDIIPSGWRDALGFELCDEIAQELSTWTQEERENFQILEIKEKFGGLTIYCNNYSNELFTILNKYYKKSMNLCIKCGKKAAPTNTYLYVPLCVSCNNQ